MRTMGRRMQGKVRLEFRTSARPTLQLEAMNLGAVVPLSEREERFFKCHDEFGRAVEGIYAAPVRSSVHPFAIGPRVISRHSGSRQSVFSSCKVQEARNAGVCAVGAVPVAAVRDRTRGGGPVLAERSQVVKKRSEVEQPTVEWHRARVLAARAACEEADRDLRSGRNPGERWVSDVGNAPCEHVPASGRRRKESCPRSACGGSWLWRVELRKRHILPSRRRCDVVRL